MSRKLDVDCEQFDAHADELALGQVDEPLRSRLLAHAADCATCHSLLDTLSTVTDRLLLAAPHIEPSAGFESRVIARLPTGDRLPVRRPLRRRVWSAVAVACVLVFAGALLVALRVDDTTTVASHADIVTINGDAVGSAHLISEPTPHVLVTIDAPRPGPGVRRCELRGPDGDWVTVGWWDAEDVSTGVWAVAVDPELLDASSMRITAEGDVLAVATFG